MSHTEKNSRRLIDELIKGYREMGGINLEEAETGLETDNEALRILEEKMTECE